ncbi:uncharacterized protein LOC130692375 [Daphnia carinata]|uniref:uncharacterized protein LOC130692375 n=1 Tax=Daphnia carinata TaxID=120202 RepID=UPI00257AA87A|nr:uncharacterized protein LOC130692375 [Daphnia carinata]
MSNDTSVNNTSSILFYPGYIKTVDGILKALQVIVGFLVIGLVASFFYPCTPLFFTAKLLLLLIATVSLMMNFCLLITCLLSISATTVISKTIFEFTYNLITFCLYLPSSIYMLVQTYSHQNYGDPEIKALISAGAFGVISSILCLVSFFRALCDQIRLYDHVEKQRENETTAALIPP